MMNTNLTRKLNSALCIVCNCKMTFLNEKKKMHQLELFEYCKIFEKNHCGRHFKQKYTEVVFVTETLNIQLVFKTTYKKLISS